MANEYECRKMKIKNSKIFTRRSMIKIIFENGVNTVLAPRDASYMFWNCPNLLELDLTNFNFTNNQLNYKKTAIALIGTVVKLNDFLIILKNK